MRFKRIYIEITNTCNLKCSFCIQNNRKPKTMSVDDFEDTLKQIQGYSDYIYLHVLGEPLSHPQLKEILECCAKYELKVNITTNGTLLYKLYPILMHSKCVRQVNVSLHSFDEAGQISQDEYLKSVLFAGDQLSKNMYISYRLWNLKTGKMDGATKGVLNTLKSHYHIEIIDEAIKRCKLGENIFLNFEETFSWPTLHQPYISNKGTCLGMKQMCAILVDRSVVPCCLDGNGECTLGNLNNQSFASIIEGKRVSDILVGFQSYNVVEELCQHCSYRLRFNKN